MTDTTSSEKDCTTKNDVSVPKWINKDYFQEILQKDVPNYQQIVNFKHVSAAAPGENYTSTIIRALMDVELKDGTIKTASYMLKTCLEGGEGAALVTSMNLFPREKQMYQTFLPKFEQLYKEADLEIHLGPRFLRVDETPEGITLVLEDLKARNFENMDRIKGMDMKHATCVLRKIAELHAVSAVYHELNGPFDDIFMESFFNEATRSLFEIVGEARDESYLKAMRTWGFENVQHLIEKFPPINDYFDEGLRVSAVDPNEFNVLNHGDCWTNNIMFNYKENGEIDEMLFVDFQIGKWGTPAQDLWYFIVTSIDLDIKIKKFDHFINIYHKRLAECLKKLKYTKHIPTLKEIHILMLKYGFWGFFSTNGLLPMILYPSNEDANISNIIKSGPEGDEFRFQIFSNPIYAKAAYQLYEFFNVKGILDIKKQ